MVWFNEPTTPIPGIVHKGYHSRSMDKQVGYNIWLPPGYEISTRRYPVIYWLHGRSNTESSNGYPLEYLREGIANGKVPPLIVVFPSGGSQTNYCDSYDGKYMGETTVIKELIPFIDEHYRTIAGREGRAIQGVSMGGFGCLRLAFKYPDLFSSVVAFAGGIRFPDELAGAHMSFGEMFNGDAEIFRSHHPETWLHRNIDQIRGNLAIQMYVGDKDELVLKGNRRMHAVLTGVKIEHGYQELPGIAHNLKRLAEQVRSKNFEIAAHAFGE